MRDAGKPRYRLGAMVTYMAPEGLITGEVWDRRNGLYHVVFAIEHEGRKTLFLHRLAETELRPL